MITTLLFAAAIAAVNERLSVVVCSSSCSERLTLPSTAEELRDVKFAWFWSDGRPPVRLNASQLRAAFPRQSPATELAIDVQTRSRAASTVIAAPIRMWGEVPENLLPHWKRPDRGPLRIATDGTHDWRVRVVGQGEGTWWRDVPRVARTVALVTSDAKPARFEVSGSKHPIAGASISVLERPTGHLNPRALALFRTDDRGVFEMPSLADAAPMSLIVSEPAHAPAAVSGRIGELPRVIELETGATVRGRFIDGDKRPVAGVDVRLEGWLANGASATFAKHAMSDTEGRWRIEGLPQRDAALVAKAPKYVPIAQKLLLRRDDIDLGDLRMVAGKSIRLMVVDDRTGKAVGDARVKGTGGREGMSNSEGIASIDQIAVDEALEVTVDARGFMTGHARIEPPFDRMARVAMTRGFEARGRFAGANGVAPEEASVRISAGNTFRAEPLASDGTFDLTLDPDRDQQLLFSAPATRELRLAIRGARGEVRDLGEIHPPEGIVIRGRVYSALDGTPVRAAAVWTPRLSGNGTIVAWATGDLLRTTTDANGAFELSGAPPGSLLLRIEAPGFARVHRAVATDFAAPVIDLGDIHLSSGTPLRIVSGDDESEAVARIDLRSEWSDVDMLTAGVQHGTASFEHIPSGEAIVTVTRGQTLLCQQSIVVPDQSQPYKIDCAANQTKVHGRVLVGNVPATGGTLTWRLSSAAPPEGIIMNHLTEGGARQQQVYGAGAGSISTQISNEGEFETSSLTPGHWQVVWNSPNGGLASPRDIEVPNEREHEMTLQYPAAVIRGVVVDEQGRSLGTARVRDKTGALFAGSGTDGSFTIRGVLPGTYQVQAQLASRASDLTEVTVSDDDPPLLRLTVRERVPKELPVTVTGCSGQPAANAFLFIESDDGSSRMLTTDPRGTAVVTFDDRLPSRIRCAAMYEGSWTFGSWLTADEAREGLTVAIASPGSALLRTKSHRGAVAIEAPNGWNLTFLLRRVGASLSVAPDLPLRVIGLPPGDYGVVLGDARRVVTVRQGQVSDSTVD